jgi:uncharacterized membrane protein
MYTTKTRSVAKAITWRVIATLTGVLIVLLLTGELEMGAMFAALDIVLKLMFFYMHERGWDAVKWGKRTHYESQSGKTIGE